MTLGPSVLRVEALAAVMTVAHYDLSQVPATWSAALLIVPLHCLQPDPPDGMVNVYCFAGDGECSIDEAGVGTLIETTSGIAGEYPTLLVDLAAKVQEYIGLGHTHLSLRFESPTGLDDYDLGAEGDVEEPTITFDP